MLQQSILRDQHAVYKNYGDFDLNFIKLILMIYVNSIIRGC